LLDRQLTANRRRAAVLLVAIVILLGGTSYAAWLLLELESTLLLPLGLFTLISPWMAYYSSHRIVIMASGAVDADPIDFAQLHNVVEEMAIAAGLPKPRVMIVDDPAPNAFATGRNADTAVVAVTTGLLEKMDREQLQAIIGHELAHVANRDILVGTLAASLTGLIMIISDFAIRLGFSSSRNRKGSGLTVLIGIAGLVLAPIGAAMLRAAVSRRREALADASAAALTRNPTGMRRALEALAVDSTEIRRISPSTSALWIEEPNPRSHGASMSWMTKLYATHPPIEERIEAMRLLEQG
jgi:heat shock protein HtpX